jgi:hypothetical protein
MTGSEVMVGTDGWTMPAIAATKSLQAKTSSAIGHRSDGRTPGLLYQHPETQDEPGPFLASAGQKRSQEHSPFCPPARGSWRGIGHC